MKKSFQKARKVVISTLVAVLIGQNVFAATTKVYADDLISEPLINDQEFVENDENIETNDTDLEVGEILLENSTYNEESTSSEEVLNAVVEEISDSTESESSENGTSTDPEVLYTEGDATTSEEVVNNEVGTSSESVLDEVQILAVFEEPVVTIDHYYSMAVDGFRCGSGDALSDDGWRIDITNWDSDYTIEAAFYHEENEIITDLFGGWVDVTSNGTLIVSSSSATFILNNNYDIISGQTYSLFRVVDTSGTQRGNDVATAYLMTNDLNGLVCGGIIDMGFETAESGTLPGVGLCHATTSDESIGEGEALQVIKWNYIEFAPYYRLVWSEWDGESWVPLWTYDVGPGAYTLDGDIVTYEFYEVEGRYSYQVFAYNVTFDELGNAYEVLLGVSDILDSEYDCSFTVDYVAPISYLETPLSYSATSSIFYSGYSTDYYYSWYGYMPGVVSQVDIYARSSTTSEDWYLIDSFNASSVTSTMEWSGTWIPSEIGLYDIMVIATDTVGNEEDKIYPVYNIAYSVFYLGEEEDTEDPTATDIEDMTIVEGGIVDLSNLLDFFLSDNVGIDQFVSTFTYTGVHGESFTETVSSYMAWGLQSFVYTEGYVDMMEGAFTYFTGIFSTAFMPEGEYTYDYYVTDLSGNRSDCDPETEGYQDCQYTINVINDIPDIDTFTADDTSPFEGQVVNFTGIFSDGSYQPEFWNQMRSLYGYTGPDISDDMYWTVFVDYGDGNTYTGTYYETGDISIPSHSYANSGVYNVSLTLTEGSFDVISDAWESSGYVEDHIDGEGEIVTANIQIDVADAIPTVSINSNPGNNVYEGTTVIFTANPINADEPVTYEWSEACWSGSNSNTVSVEFNTPGIYQCGVTIVDEDGDVAEASVTVTVNNYAPEVTISSSRGTYIDDSVATILTANISGGNEPYIFEESDVFYGWSGDCSGTDLTFTLPNVVGVYTCTYEIYDADGDFSSGTITVEVYKALPKVIESITEVLISDVKAATTTESTGESCVKYTLSGYLYLDSNKNGLKDESEKTFENINVIITLKSDNKSITVKTDKNGYWEIELCGGEYIIEVEDVKGFVLAEKEIKVLMEDTNLNYNIKLIEVGNSFNWILLIIVILIIIITILVVGIWYIRKRSS